MPKVNIESRRFAKGKRFTVYILEVTALTSIQCYFARDWRGGIKVVITTLCIHNIPCESTK